MKRLFSAVAALASLALCATSSQASITVSGSSGNLAAEAVFTVVDSDTFTVQLTNTSTYDVGVPSEVLTAVFFDFSKELTRVSAELGASSNVYLNGSLYQAPPLVVGGEFAYRGDLVAGEAPGDAEHGISSSGLDLFGPTDRFPGSDLQPPTSPDGLQYGITSAGDNVTTGNAKVLGSQLIKNSVVFTFSGSFTALDESSIANVTFQYGTDMGTEPQLPGEGPTVPEPTTLAIWGLGLGIAGLVRLSRRK